MSIVCKLRRSHKKVRDFTNYLSSWNRCVTPDFDSWRL